jgi:hypothetical protein
MHAWSTNNEQSFMSKDVSWSNACAGRLALVSDNAVTNKIGNQTEPERKSSCWSLRFGNPRPIYKKLAHAERFKFLRVHILAYYCAVKNFLHVFSPVPKIRFLESIF